MQTKTIDNEGVAKALAGDALLAFRRLADGSMVIIAANGMKLHFSAEKVREAETRLNIKEGEPAANTRTPGSRVRALGAGPRRGKQQP